MTTQEVMTTVGTRCSIARSLEVLGEKWTLLVVREAFFGLTRFSEFRSALGIASDILTNRLATLVEIGVMEKRSYREGGSRERFSYHLTESGRALRVVLASLKEWGDENRPSPAGPASRFTDETTGEPVRLAFVDASGRVVERAAVRVVRDGNVLAG
jgi:DNA-binding HxlR family transcriptional regulator